jgi:hypothetical protein
VFNHDDEEHIGDIDPLGYIGHVGVLTMWMMLFMLEAIKWILPAMSMSLLRIMVIIWVMLIM